MFRKRQRSVPKIMKIGVIVLKTWAIERSGLACLCKRETELILSPGGATLCYRLAKIMQIASGILKMWTVKHISLVYAHPKSLQ